MSAEEAARENYERLIAGWNAADAEAMIASLDDESLVIGFDGSEMLGRDAALEQLGAVFADHETARYVTKVRTVTAIGANTALLHAVAGMVPPNGEEVIADRNAIQTLVVGRRAATWVVVLFQNTPAKFHGRPDLAAALSAELNQLVE